NAQWNTPSAGLSPSLQEMHGERPRTECVPQGQTPFPRTSPMVTHEADRRIPEGDYHPQRYIALDRLSPGFKNTRKPDPKVGLIPSTQPSLTPDGKRPADGNSYASREPLSGYFVGSIK